MAQSHSNRGEQGVKRQGVVPFPRSEPSQFKDRPTCKKWGGLELGLSLKCFGVPLARGPLFQLGRSILIDTLLSAASLKKLVQELALACVRLELPHQLLSARCMPTII